MSEANGPGTPLGRLKAIADFAIAHGLCTGVEAKPAELFVMEALAAAQAHAAEDLWGMSVIDAYSDGFAAGIEAAAQWCDENGGFPAEDWQKYGEGIRALRPPAAPAPTGAQPVLLTGIHPSYRKP